MNPLNFLQLKPSWEQFKSNHPKFLPFLKAATEERFIDQGTVIEINVTNSTGKTISSNVRLKADDMEFLLAFKNIINS
ncbi:MAG: hypothetical protein LIP16_10095 [Clostridium sp.]|nr:hypothetical protein [Clostridium sp.]